MEHSCRLHGATEVTTSNTFVNNGHLAEEPMQPLDAMPDDEFYLPEATSRSYRTRRSGKPRAMVHRGVFKICAVLLVLFTGMTFYQRLTMECNIFRKNSNHFERVYNEAQDEVAEWRRKYDVEHARAQECNTDVEKALQQRTKELNDALKQLHSLQEENRQWKDLLVKPKADLLTHEKVVGLTV